MTYLGDRENRNRMVHGDHLVAGIKARETEGYLRHHEPMWSNSLSEKTCCRPSILFSAAISATKQHVLVCRQAYDLQTNSNVVRCSRLSTNDCVNSLMTIWPHWNTPSLWISWRLASGCIMRAWFPHLRKSLRRVFRKASSNWSLRRRLWQLE